MNKRIPAEKKFAVVKDWITSKTAMANYSEAAVLQ